MTEPTVTQAPDDRRRRTALLAGGAAAALVLVLVLVLLLSGGGDGGSTSSTTQPSSRPSGATTTTTAPGSGSRETFEVFTTKNPFLPLRSTGGAATASGSSTPGSAAPAPGGTAGGTSGGGSAGAPAGGTGSATGAGGGGTAEPRRGARVALQDVFMEGGKVKANVRVNDTVYKVVTGEVFATSFKVVSLSQSDRCGRFLLGDDPFRLCKGEQLLK